MDGENIQEIIISQTVKVDDCIAQEIVYLNSVGIHTIGCCCGHGTSQPEAIIKPSSQPRAEELGYKTRFQEEHPSNWFVELKSKCNCPNPGVSWQEAIEAWLGGKTISYILNGEEFKISKDQLYLSQGTRPISKDELGKCKWFVKE